MRRGMTTYTAPRPALLSLLLCAGCMALCVWGAAFPAFNTSLMVLMAAPVFLLLTGQIAGFVPMGACAGVMLLALYLTGGAALALCGAAYLLPLLAVYGYCLVNGVRFWKTCGLTAGALLLSQVGIYAVLSRLTGGELYARAAQGAADAVAGFPGRDNLLYMLTSAGIFRLPAAMRDTALILAEDGKNYQLSAQAVDELLKQLRAMSADLLQNMMPSLLVSGSAMNALLGVSLGVSFGGRAARRRAFKRDEAPLQLPNLDMPPFSQWHIPRPWGLRVGLLAAGYPLALLSGDTALGMAGALMWQAFMVCYTVQGAAALNFNQRQRGTRKGWRIAVLALAGVVRIFQTVLMCMGVLDQMTNTRALRPPLKARGEGRED